MAKLILLGPAHDVVGRREDQFDGATVEEVLKEAVIRYGVAFEKLLEISQVWLNGESVAPSTRVGPYDEVLVLPPVSGG